VFLVFSPSVSEDAIRIGDCLAMLIEYYHSTGEFHTAHLYMEEMNNRRIALHPYVDAQAIKEV
jgi:hypothetical protein